MFLIETTCLLDAVTRPWWPRPRACSMRSRGHVPARCGHAALVAVHRHLLATQAARQSGYRLALSESLCELPFPGRTPCAPALRRHRIIRNASRSSGDCCLRVVHRDPSERHVPRVPPVSPPCSSAIATPCNRSGPSSVVHQNPGRVRWTRCGCGPRPRPAVRVSCRSSAIRLASSGDAVRHLAGPWATRLRSRWRVATCCACLDAVQDGCRALASMSEYCFEICFDVGA